MKRNLSLWSIIGFTFTSVCGVLLHFIYDWSGKSKIAALFSGVNESVWEHIKLLFFPLLIFAIIQSFYFREYKSFWCVKLISAIIGTAAIPIIFYTLNGAFGKTPDVINITIFVVSAALAFLYEWLLFKRDNLRFCYPRAAIFLLLLGAVCFFVFTFYPPRLPIFADPITNSYGI